MGRGGGGKRNSVMFAKPNEPAFLRRMKEQLGYKDEGPSVDTKREVLPTLEHEDTVDKDDEKPTIVVIKPGDLSAEQVEQLGGIKDEEDEETGVNRKVIFKKPTKKRVADEAAGSSTDSKMEKKEASSKPVKNKSLLSFDDEDDDD